MLTIQDLTMRVAGRVLVEGASAQIPHGKKIGLVGRNGSGKTTLLRAILGEVEPDDGEITLPAGLRIGTVAQDPPDGPEALLDVVLAADAERARLLSEADSSADPHRLAAIHDRLLDIDAHSAPARAAAILAGLGFDEAAQRRPVGDFSGGWRMRVALAACLFARPDLLLLDEPTNHLDLEAAVWLEAYLAAYPRTLILVSHDRDLLNRVPDSIMHLHDRRLRLFSGGYDKFERTRAEEMTRQAALRKRQEREREHIQAFIDRFRYKASKARQAQSRIKMLERMEPIATVVDQTTATFSFPAPKPLAPPILTLEDAAVGYADGAAVLSRLTLRLDTDDRVALLGANGNGKTTLMRLLAQQLPRQSGEMARSKHLKVGYFAQDVLEGLEPTATASAELARRAADWLPQKVRAHLGRFGLTREKAETAVSDLSGGEKARLALAAICLDAPNLLLLDEPTNHLDVDARQALVQALTEFDGAVILASHDPHLVEMLADRLWLVADGTCTPFEGTLDDYRALLLDQRRRERREKQSAARSSNGAVSRKDQRRARAQERADSKALRRVEAALEKLTSERRSVHAELASPDLYEGDQDRLAALTRRAATLDAEIAEAEAQWLELSERLDTPSP